MLHLVRQKSCNCASLYYSKNSGEVGLLAFVPIYRKDFWAVRLNCLFLIGRYISFLCSSLFANFLNNKLRKKWQNVFLETRYDRYQGCLIHYETLKSKMKLLTQRKKAFSPFCYCMTIDINVLLCNKFPPKLLFEIINRS